MKDYSMYKNFSFLFDNMFSYKIFNDHYDEFMDLNFFFKYDICDYLVDYIEII